MRGYISRLKGMLPKEQRAEIKRKLHANDHKSYTSGEFSCTSVPNKRERLGRYEQYITKVEIEKELVRVRLNYTASGDQDNESPFSGDRISGEAVALIDDDGELRYKSIAAEVDEDSFSAEDDKDARPHPSAALSDIGSTLWYERWMAAPWKLAKTGSGALHQNINGHEAAVMEDKGSPGVWRHGVECVRGRTIEWSRERHSCKADAKRAALAELARVLGKKA